MNGTRCSARNRASRGDGDREIQDRQGDDRKREGTRKPGEEGQDTAKRNAIFDAVERPAGGNAAQCQRQDRQRGGEIVAAQREQHDGRADEHDDLQNPGQVRPRPSLTPRGRSTLPVFGPPRPERLAVAGVLRVKNRGAGEQDARQARGRITGAHPRPDEPDLQNRVEERQQKHARDNPGVTRYTFEPNTPFHGRANCTGTRGSGLGTRVRDR